MAIVKSGVTANGVHYTIHDDFAARPGTPEYEERRQAQCRAAYAILLRAAQKNAAAETNQQKKGATP